MKDKIKKYIIGDDGDKEELCSHGIGHGDNMHTCDGCCMKETNKCKICQGYGSNGADDTACLNCGGSGEEEKINLAVKEREKELIDLNSLKQWNIKKTGIRY